MEHYDVIVAGVGAMGAAALHELSGRGARVLAIEPHGVPHGHGSSGGDTRLIRKAYFEHPDYVPLLERAYAGWRALEADGGEPVLHTPGILYIGPPDGDLVGGTRRSAAEHGLEVESLDAAALASAYPQFRCPVGCDAIFEPDAGFVLSERAIRMFTDRALDRGASLRVGERLVSWHAGHGEVQVTTESARYAAGSLVITAGAWTGHLLAGMGLPLTVTRQPLFWLRPVAAARFELGQAPCWAVQRAGQPGLMYGVPALPGHLASRVGVKLARHHPGEPADPDGPRRTAVRGEFDALLASVAPFVPGLAGALTATHVCLYTNSRDGHFILDVHPDHPNVVFACGFSGHGFKFAPVIGEALADLVLDGRSALPVEFLRVR